MPTFKLVSDNLAVSSKLKKLRESIEGVKKSFLEEMAAIVVLNSPVDTGAYMDSLNIVAGRGSAPGYSSDGRPRNQAWGPFADDALARMFSQIEAVEDANVVSITNNAPHAAKVEYEHGYAPFSKARSLADSVAGNLKK